MQFCVIWSEAHGSDIVALNAKPMKTIVSTRQSMILSGLLQGGLMLGLHEWLKAYGFKTEDMYWLIPAYVLAILLSLTFNFLRSEFSIAKSLAGALIPATIIAATAVWLGCSIHGAASSRTNEWIGKVVIFAHASMIVWFVGLPFIQTGLRSTTRVHTLRFADFPYIRLFDDAWRNALLLANCLLFTGLFWLLLALWAGLFVVLNIGFFKDLFSSHFFFYIATAMAISFAASLEEKEMSALTTLRRYLLAFQTRLLPLAVLIALLFLGTLLFSGLDPLWRTGHATPLMLSLQIAIICLSNAAWQDGGQAPPFSAPLQWLIRLGLLLLPVLSALGLWALSLRIMQYGWSIDRVWAALAVVLTTLYSAGYAVSAARSVLMGGWLPGLGKVNTWMALLCIGSLLAIHTPLLDPQRIAARSQVARLLSGAVVPAQFDFNYLRFSLGAPGKQALEALAELSEHPEADEIRSRAKSALQNQYATKTSSEQPILPMEEMTARLKVYPPGTPLPAGFREYLHARLEKEDRFDYTREALKKKAQIPVIVLDLGGGPEPEVVVMNLAAQVFAFEKGKWRQIGRFRYAGASPDLLPLEKDNFSAEPRTWSDLRLGDQHLTLELDGGE